MTFQDKTIEEIINDKEYPLINVLNDVIDRIKKLSGEITEQRDDSSISYYIRNMNFATIIPEEDYVLIRIEMPYARIIDLSQACQVDYYKGKNGVDIINYHINSDFEKQYGISLVRQAFTYFKRLKL